MIKVSHLVRKKSNFQCFTKDFLHLIRKTRLSEKIRSFQCSQNPKDFLHLVLKIRRFPKKNPKWSDEPQFIMVSKSFFPLQKIQSFCLLYKSLGYQTQIFVKNKICKPSSKWASLTRAHRVHCLRMAVMSLRTCLLFLKIKNIESFQSAIVCGFEWSK